MTQYTGKAEFRIGGVLIETLDGAKIDNPMAESRKGVKGAHVYGWTRDSEIPMISGDVPMRSDLVLADLWSLVDDTCTFECDDGTIFILPGATMAKADLATGGDVGKYSIQIIGNGPCIQA